MHTHTHTHTGTHTQYIHTHTHKMQGDTSSEYLLCEVAGLSTSTTRPSLLVSSWGGAPLPCDTCTTNTGHLHDRTKRKADGCLGPPQVLIGGEEVKFCTLHIFSLYIQCKDVTLRTICYVWKQCVKIIQHDQQDTHPLSTNTLLNPCYMFRPSWPSSGIPINTARR